MRLEMSTSEAEALATSLRELRHQIDLMELRWAADAARLAASGYHGEQACQNPSEGGWKMTVDPNGEIMVLRPPPTFAHSARGPDLASAA
jgi:hypothetical protein